MGEKWHSWSDVTPTDDFLCATLTLYWITQSITSSMRDYWDNRWHPVDPTYVSTPTAFGVFAHQTVPEIIAVGSPHLYCCLISYTTPPFVCPPNGVVP